MQGEPISRRLSNNLRVSPCHWSVHECWWNRSFGCFFVFSSLNILNAHNSPPLQSDKAQSWPNVLKRWVLGAPGVVIMKSCSGLEQADYRDNEGLGCCRVIAAPLQDSGFFSLFFLVHQTTGMRSHFSIRHCSSQQEPVEARGAHFTTCMCDLATLLRSVCVSEAVVRDSTPDSH